MVATVSPSGPDPPVGRRLPLILADVAALLEECGYSGYLFVLYGYPPNGDPRLELRVPCPSRAPPPTRVSDPEEGSNADLILSVLREATAPMTVGEISLRATNGEPTGAFRRSLRRLVRDGQVSEHVSGRSTTYELA